MCSYIAIDVKLPHMFYFSCTLCLNQLQNDYKRLAIGDSRCGFCLTVIIDTTYCLIPKMLLLSY